jgi:nucleoside-diphosphate-sugar epimerase
LLAELSRRRSDVRAIGWGEVAGLDAGALLARLERELEGAQACDVVFANGRTDPRFSPSELLFSNFEFPQLVVETLGARVRDARFLTLGTIMERFPAACAANAYLASKARLGQWMAEQSARAFAHVRLHTVYGGAPKRHMFLGQMADAISSGKVFKMSSGQQLREYHHAEDIALSLAAILEREWDFGSAVEISSGAPLRLCDLARGVFSSFGKESLLEVGAISGASGENTEQVFPRSEAWLLPASREPLAGVVESLREFVGGGGR